MCVCVCVCVCVCTCARVCCRRYDLPSAMCLQQIDTWQIS